MCEQATSTPLPLAEEGVQVVRSIRAAILGLDDKAPGLLGMSTLDRHHVQLMGVLDDSEPVGWPENLPLIEDAVDIEPGLHRELLHLFARLSELMPACLAVGSQEGFSRWIRLTRIKAMHGVVYNVYGGIVVYRDVKTA